MIAGMCRGLTGFWCTDGYAVCGYAEAAATSKDIVVSVDDVGVSKTPGLRVNAPPSADRRSAAAPPPRARPRLARGQAHAGARGGSRR